jgi:hypothetical protein
MVGVEAKAQVGGRKLTVAGCDPVSLTGGPPGARAIV